MKTIINIALLCAILFAVSLPAFAAGSCTNPPQGVYEGGKMVYTITCTCDASGQLSGNPFKVEPGDFEGVRFVPGTGGDAPTDLFDIEVRDADGGDLLSGGGANIPSAKPDYRGPDRTVPLAVVNRTVDIVGTNMGNARKVTINVFIRITK